MPIGRLWAGRACGTNIGNLIMNLEGEDSALCGKLRLLDNQVGIAVYSIAGSFDGSLLKIAGEPEASPEGQKLGALSAHARLNSKGELHGERQPSIGTAGTFVLYPHDQQPDQTPDKASDSPA